MARLQVGVISPTPLHWTLGQVADLSIHEFGRAERLHAPVHPSVVPAPARANPSLLFTLMWGGHNHSVHPRRTGGGALIASEVRSLTHQNLGRLVIRTTAHFLLWQSTFVTNIPYLYTQGRPSDLYFYQFDINNARSRQVLLLCGAIVQGT